MERAGKRCSPTKRARSRAGPVSYIVSLSLQIGGKARSTRRASSSRQGQAAGGAPREARRRRNRRARGARGVGWPVAPATHRAVVVPLSMSIRRPRSTPPTSDLSFSLAPRPSTPVECHLPLALCAHTLVSFISPRLSSGTSSSLRHVAAVDGLRTASSTRSCRPVASAASPRASRRSALTRASSTNDDGNPQTATNLWTTRCQARGAPFPSVRSFEPRDADPAHPLGAKGIARQGRSGSRRRPDGGSSTRCRPSGSATTSTFQLTS